MKEYQLRIYRIKPGTMADFIQAWRQYIVPLREKYGFKVVSAGNNEQRSEFAWLLSYDGPEGYAARDAEYYQSPERNSLPAHMQQYVENMEIRILQDVPIH